MVLSEGARVASQEPQSGQPVEARASRPWAAWALPAVFVGFTLLRLAVLPRLGLFNDEAYYWAWSRRLAASYFDHPPAVAYLIAASTALFGRTQLAVHLPALVLSVLTPFVLYRLALALFPGRRDIGWWTVVLATTAPLFGIGAVFTLPDGPLMLTWALAALLAWRAAEGDPRLWYLVGVVAGLGLLSKYGFVLLPPAILGFLAWRKPGVLRRKEPWIAALVMVLLFAPVLLWNLHNDFVSFHYHLVDRQPHSAPFWKTFGRFLLGQQSLSPLVWLTCIAGLVHSWRRARRGSDAHAFLFLGGVVPLAFFGILSLFAWVNPNWYAPGFLPLMVAAAELLAGARSRVVKVAPVALAAALTLVFYLQAVTLVLPIPPKTDFATDLNGWEEVGERLRAEVAALPDPAHAFVFSRRLQLSAMAAFYGGDGLDVTRLGGRRHDQYDFWRRPERRGEDAVYLCDDQHYAAPKRVPFARCEPTSELPIVRAGRRIRTFFFWRCRDYRPTAPTR